MLLSGESPALPWKAAVLAARRGDRSAFEALVGRIQRRVDGVCVRVMSSEAEAAEVAQEAFLRAYQNLHRYDEDRPFDLWVLAIARNRCLDQLRRRQKLRTEDGEELRETLPS